MKNTKRFYLAARKEINKFDYAIVVTIRQGDNVPAVLAKLGVKTAELCPSKRAAEQLAEEWNELYRNNGTSVYSVAAG